ncbi:hypothetical protein XENOCAPTIV_010736, partial [Xenoophorus captivus]
DRLPSLPVPIPGPVLEGSEDELPPSLVPVPEEFVDELYPLPVPVLEELKDELPPLPVTVLEELKDELPSLPVPVPGPVLEGFEDGLSPSAVPQRLCCRSPGSRCRSTGPRRRSPTVSALVVRVPAVTAPLVKGSNDFCTALQGFTVVQSLTSS